MKCSVCPIVPRRVPYFVFVNFAKRDRGAKRLPDFLAIDRLGVKAVNDRVSLFLLHRRGVLVFVCMNECRCSAVSQALLTQYRVFLW